MRKMWKRCMSLGLVLVMALHMLPEGAWYLPVKEAEASAVPTDDINENDLLSANYINNPMLLAYLQDMLATHKGKAANAVTIGDLMSYKEEIVLPANLSEIDNVIGLGYARGATKFDLSNLTKVNRIEDWEFYYCDVVDVVLPDCITEIGGNAFSNCKKMRTIYLPSNLKTIQYAAFYTCSALMSVILPDGLETIGTDAFKGCSSLASITIPNTVKNLGSAAFMNCGNLSVAALPDTLEVVPTEFFSGNERLATVNLPDSLKELGNHSFRACISLGEMDFTNTQLVTIGDYAFGNTGAIELSLPTTLQTIGNLAFQYSGIREAVLPEGLLTLGEKAFLGCGRLTKITLPASLDTIKNETFSGCKTLKTVKITNIESNKSILKLIGERAFMGCYSLPGTQFLKGLPELKEIGKEAFSNCTAIYKKTVNSVERNVKNILGEDYRWANFLIVELPDSVETLGESVFANNYALQKADLENTKITQLPKFAFQNCDKLVKVALPKQLEAIGESAFDNCGSLSQIEFPEDTLKQIEQYAFRSCGKNRIASNEHVDSEFKVYWMYVKEELLFQDNMLDNAHYMEAFVMKDKTFEGVDMENGNLSESGKVDYKYTEQAYIKLSQVIGGEETFDRYTDWLDSYYRLAEVMEPVLGEEEREGYVQVGVPMDNSFMAVCQDYYVVSNQSILEKLVYTQEELDAIGKTQEEVDEIKRMAEVFNKYGSCPQTISVIDINTENPETLKGVGNYFTGMVDLVLPDSVEEMGKGVFQSCVSLRTVKLPASLKVLPESAFAECGTRTRLPDNVAPTVESDLKQSKGVEAHRIKNGVSLYAYEGLRKVKFNEGLEEIGTRAFDKCSAFDLENGYLPNSLTQIGNYAFSECASLTKFTAPKNLTRIGEFAFNKAATIGKYDYSYEEVGTNTTKWSQLDAPLPYGGLNEVDFRSSGSRLASIGKNAFYCTNLMEVDLMPATNLKGVETSTFEACRQLKNITLGNAVEYVGASAFGNNPGLRSVSVPTSVVLDKNMFKGNTYNTVSMQLRNISPNQSISVNYLGEVDLPIYVVSEATKNSNGLDVRYKEEGAGEAIVKCTTDKIGELYGNQVNLVTVIGKKAGKTEIVVGCKMVFPTVGKLNMVTQPEVSYTVNVTEKPCKSIQFDKERYLLSIANPNASLTLEPKVEPEDTTDAFQWTNSQEGVVSIEPLTTPSPVDGEALVLPKAKVTLPSAAPALGESEITLQAGAVSGKCYVDVVVPATSIALSASSISLYPGKTERLEATLTYDPKYDATLGYVDRVSYASSNEEVATVDGEGEVTAVGVGTATITARAMASGTTRTCSVTVAQEDLKIVLSYKEQGVESLTQPIVVNAGTPERIDIATDPVDSVSDMKAYFSQEDVLSYAFVPSGNSKKTGIQLTAKKPGTTDLVVYPAFLTQAPTEPDPQSKVTVDVVADATKVTLKNVPNLDVGKKDKLFQSLTTALGSANTIENVPNVTSDALEFTSSDPSVASVDANTGEVTALSPGTVTITATSKHKYGGGSVTSGQVIEVNYPPAISLTINGKATLYVGETAQYVTELNPPEARNGVTFSIAPGSSTAILSVTENGMVTALAKGSAKIRATTDNNVVKDFNVTVIQPATDIQWLKNDITVNVGGNYVLTQNRDYKLLPEGATDAMTWLSTNPGVATVDEKSGQVTGVSIGTVTMEGTTASGFKTQVNIRVLCPATAVSLPGAFQLNVGKKKALAAVMTPANATDALTWKASNEKVAKVDANGVVTAVAKGTCDIYVTTTSGRQASCRVTVTVASRSVKLLSVMANKKTIYLERKKIITLTARMTPEDSTDSIKWTSSKKKVATVDATRGTVTAKKKGTAKITAKASSGKKATIKVCVVNKPLAAKKVKLAKKKTVKRNKTLSLAAKVTPAKSTETLTWASKNSAIATVDAFGIVKGVKKGKTTITVRTSSGKTSQCKVTVK